MNKLKLLFMTSRPISWVNTAYPFAAGYVMLGGGFGWQLVIGTLFFLTAYNLLMYGVNDVFDYESDIRNPRKGGVEGAVTLKKYHKLILTAAFGGTAVFVLPLAFLGDAVSNAVLAGVLFFVVAYSMKYLRFKEIPFLDSVTSSIHFVGPLVYAYSLVGATESAWIVAAAFFLWGIASHAFGAVQDILPDREAGISSIATVFGARATVLFSTVSYLASSLLVVSIGGIAASVVALTGLAYAVNVGRFIGVNDQSSQQTRSGWRNFLWLNYVAGAIVTMACIAIYTP